MGPEGIRIARVADHSFLTAPIAPGSVIVDLGVNVGDFARGMIAMFGCSVVGVEPVPALLAAIPATERLTVDQLAITRSGEATTLFVNPSSTAATTDERLVRSDAPSVRVDGISLAGFLDRHRLARVALVKVDIEGAETAMIQDATLETLRRVDQFTIEFHDFLDPALVPEVRRAKQRLRSAGFVELAMSGDNSDVLFVNRAQIPFGPYHHAAAVFAYKYPRGVGRRVERRIRALRSVLPDRRAA
ncbi:MAG: FkbM family methyltransferase [Solirubrobacteraceae bacterium]